MRTHVDLFTGLAGFSLAAKANGIRTVLMCEIDPFLREGLARAWPGVEIHDDVNTLDGSKWRGVWLLSGGVPCQPVSCAGKRRGAADDRWLWPAAIRVLAEVRPRWALFENPTGLESMGLDGVLADVESAGYEVGTLDIPACAVNAPHRRARLWIVAHARDGQHCANGYAAGESHGISEEYRAQHPVSGRTGGTDGVLAHAASCPTGTPAPISGGRSSAITSGNAEGIVADASIAGHEGADAEPGAHGRSAEHRQGILADAGCVSGVGRQAWQDSGTQYADGRNEAEHPGERSSWDSFVWLPCADGKFRRAPACPVCLAHGVQPEIPGELEQCQSKGKGPRKLLGALGNSIVWPVAAEIIQAMIRSEG